MKAKDLHKGLKINNITLIKKVKRPKHLKCTGSYWLYECVCGNRKISHATNFVRSPKISCGCRSHPKKYNTKSKKYYRRMYDIWFHAKKRCYNVNDKNYKDYGARGIKMEKRWLDYANFYNDMIDSYEPGMTIERVNNDLGYSKENCIWIPNAEQAKNRRSSYKNRVKNKKPWKYKSKVLNY